MPTSPKTARHKAGRKPVAQNKVVDPANYVPPPRLLASIIRKSTDALGNPIVEVPAEALEQVLPPQEDLEPQAALELEQELRSTSQSWVTSKSEKHTLDEKS